MKLVKLANIPAGLVAATALLAGCLNSPLFNHAKAENSGQRLQLAPRGSDASGCQLSFPQQGFCAKLSWDRFPTDDDAGEFTLRFWNPSLATEHGPYLTPALTVAAKLWMPSMGHGSSPIRIIQTGDVYKGSNVYFMMSGEWELFIQLKQDRTVVEQAKLDLEI